MDLDIPLHETVKHLATAIDTSSRRSNTPDVITITTDQGLAKQLQNQMSAVNVANQPPVASIAAANTVTPVPSKKRKRHIAIDVETERAKLNALLNSTQSPGNYCYPQSSSSK